MNTIEDYLRKNAVLYPNKRAIVCDSDSVTYSELLDRVEKRSCYFREEGIARKGYAILKATQNIDFLVDYFGIHECGCVAVPIEPSTPDQRLSDLDSILSAAVFPLQTADILFTTGTTGKSKGVVISHEAILANTENLVEAHRYSNDLNFIICGPLNHLGSLSKVYPTLQAGGCIYILEGMKDINAFFQVLENEGRFATFLVPASIRMLLQIHKSRLASYASKLDFIETGAAPMTLSEMEELRSAIPQTRLYNTYASTETGIVATYNFNCDHCKAGCVGKPLKNSSFSIGENGNVICNGKTLMTEYISEKALTAEVMKNGAVVTSDLGQIDEEGMLHLIGRKDDVINVGGYKVSPIEVEEAAMTHADVLDCICISGLHPVIGTVLKLLLVMKEGAILNKKDFYKYLGSLLESYKIPFFYEKVEKIERTYNGKINRKFYR